MVIRLAILLILLAGSARADSLRLVVPEMQPVVGEMIPVTLRGEYTRQITLETLTFPGSDTYDWVQLARDQWRDEQIGGRTVRVFERRLAVFPRHSGPLAIGPVTHHLTVVGANNLREPLDVTAPPISLPVAPFPGPATPLSARHLAVEDTLSTAPGALRDGETLVRRVTVTADGTLPHLLPPRPAMREPWLISFAAPEQRELRLTPEGPVTTVTWDWHLRPKTGEPGVLPAVALPWFDTVTRQMRVAEIPAIPFGYASFGDNRSGTEHLTAGQAGAAFFTFAAGTLAGLGAAFAGMSRRRKADMLRNLRQLSPFDPSRRALKRAVRTEDPLALRRAAEPYLRRRRELGLPLSGRETADLDEFLYGRAGHGSAFDAETQLRQILGRQDRARDVR
ncbi:hypothetical protein LGR54_04785 [Ancylobacter sp. Lp-2]|uniref:hypothetical protein n=1 Tax=Ancylobacter sp. Lp-2 TaxID=2881339 RepID=UPI001E2C199D|nr:hypothetical protein [Ancylobacter sp. Lp-2]MCB4767912.1 hypothetical protein [Ancylobacter sp. Lp-2]